MQKIEMLIHKLNFLPTNWKELIQPDGGRLAETIREVCLAAWNAHDELESAVKALMPVEISPRKMFELPKPWDGVPLPTVTPTGGFQEPPVSLSPMQVYSAAGNASTVSDAVEAATKIAEMTSPHSPPFPRSDAQPLSPVTQQVDAMRTREVAVPPQVAKGLQEVVVHCSNMQSTLVVVRDSLQQMLCKDPISGLNYDASFTNFRYKFVNDVLHLCWLAAFGLRQVEVCEECLLLQDRRYYTQVARRLYHQMEGEAETEVKGYE